MEGLCLPKMFPQNSTIICPLNFKFSLKDFQILGVQDDWFNTWVFKEIWEKILWIKYELFYTHKRISKAMQCQCGASLQLVFTKYTTHWHTTLKKCMDRSHVSWWTNHMWHMSLMWLVKSTYIFSVSFQNYGL